MKKNQRMEKEFTVLKKQCDQIQEIVHHTSVGNLWSHEAAVRKKLKALKNLDQHMRGFEEVYDTYLELLDQISERLLEDYNQKQHTAYSLKEVIADHPEGYLSSGIMTVLMTHHIPKQVATDFEKVFPENPKDEYPRTRQIKRRFYLHLGETNTGKTYQALERLKQSQKGVYLAPLRILALEVFERLNEEGISCDLLTGEEEIRKPDAGLISSTIEKLNLDQDYEVAVIDEIQLIADPQRGSAWTRAVLGLRCQEIHICGALNAERLLREMLTDCDDVYTIKYYTRQVPLAVEESLFDLRGVVAGDALITFSKKRVLELAELYKNKGIKTSIIYGDLPPEVRKMQYQDFVSGESHILVSTDAIGMGVNLPIRRIVFMDIKKFDGYEVRYLTSQEVKQIAGRAGRLGIYEVGYVNARGNQLTFIREQLACEDHPLEEAVLGPSEALLKIKALPLREKLALWATREEKCKMYRKMDVRDYLMILDLVRKYKLSEQDEWQLMRLPFDVHNEQLQETLLQFIEAFFVRGEKQMHKPVRLDKGLDYLETYYQQVNLYYAFSKNFHLELDEVWVEAQRVEVSKQINRIITS